MKFSQKVSTLFFLIIFSATFATAQSEEWKTISPIQEGFTAEVPDSQYEEAQISIKNKEPYSVGSYRAFKNNTYFFISTAKHQDWGLPGLVEDFAKENEAKPQIFQSGSVKGNKYVFGDNEGFYHTVVSIKIDNWQYLFHIVSQTPNDKDADRVLNSIKFIKDSDLIENTTNLTKSTASKLEEPNSKSVSQDIGQPNTVKKSGGIGSGSGGGIGYGVGAGTGSGVGSGDGRGNPPPPARKPKPVGPTTGIQILTKPRPGYTDLARLYNIRGVVRVKVAFLSDGRIGSVNPTSRLPFGLTNKAIKAARQIKFNPPMRNGVKYSVVKTVVYNFFIY